MLLLALDTSTRQASLALCSEDMLSGEHTWHVGNNHSVELLDHVQRIFVECGKRMADIDGVAVATGPGSFNGLRVALATAKALAFSLQKPLVGISTLDVIAAQQRQWTGPICALLEAGRGELYAACYAFERVADADATLDYRLQRLSEYQLLSPQEVSDYLLEQADTWLNLPGEHDLPPFLLCGEIKPASRQALHEHMQERAIFVGGPENARHASALALLAMQRLAEGSEDDPLLLEPLYIRRPSITTSTRKQPILNSEAGTSVGQSDTEREEGALRH